VNEGAGARTPMSIVVAWVLVIVTVLALTPLFTDLPEAVLAALIIHAVSHLMKVAEMRRFHRLMPREFWLAMLTLLAVITLDVLPALLLGVGLSLVLLVYRASKPRLSMLGRDPLHPGAYEDVERHPDASALSGLLIIRPDAPVFYANAQAVRDGVTAAATSRDDIAAVLIDLDANDQLDITSVEALTKLVADLHAHGQHVGLVHLHGPALDIAARTGLLDALGPNAVLPNVEAGVQWARGLTHETTAEPDGT
jgi:sulfate permease, SulP family